MGTMVSSRAELDKEIEGVVEDRTRRAFNPLDISKVAADDLHVNTPIDYVRLVTDMPYLLDYDVGKLIREKLRPYIQGTAMRLAIEKGMENGSSQDTE